ncbi:hypothetical protein T492DRAFT_107797 [Pavlovales sp. CCMP2436]|nr:hypothetical protein T492DRAFT_107797 [Pavlovales sp. CCMP2436]
MLPTPLELRILESCKVLVWGYNARLSDVSALAQAESADGGKGGSKADGKGAAAKGEHEPPALLGTSSADDAFAHSICAPRLTQLGSSASTPRRCQGHLDAQHDLGFCYRDGTGVPQNDREAARLFRRAANKGHAHSLYELGICCARGKGIPLDDDEAARLYRRAAELGFGAAQYALGQCHEQGKGVPSDDREAARLFGLAAEQGTAAAQFNLRVLHESGRGGLLQNDGEAARLYPLAAEQGFAKAQVCYGY